MKKLVLPILILTLAFGLIPFRASALLTAEEETLTDSLTASDSLLTTSCSDDLSGEEYIDCLEGESEDSSNICTEELETDSSSDCYIDLDAYDDGDEEADESEIEDSEVELDEDDDFFAGFTEEDEEEEGEPASIVPVAVATILGLVAIVALNLAGKKK